jgi:hypothetical protein
MMIETSDDIYRLTSMAALVGADMLVVAVVALLAAVSATLRS